MKKKLPICPNCNGFGQIDKHHRDWVCNMCKGTGTTDPATIERVERLRAAPTPPQHKQSGEAMKSEEAKRRLMEDPEFKAAYEAPDPEWEAEKAAIDAKIAAQPTPNQGELDKLTDMLGDICHEHYKGCTQVGDVWEYAYDNEVVWMLKTPEALALITAQVQAAEAKGRREFAQKLASSNNWRVDIEDALGEPTNE